MNNLGRGSPKKTRFSRTLSLLSSARQTFVQNSVDSSLSRQNESNDEPVESQGLSKDENQDHTDEEFGLLCGSSYTSISDNSNGHTSSQTRESYGQSRSKISKPFERTIGAIVLN